MTYEIAWTYAARWVLHELPLHSAMLVDRAVIRFAAAGEGELGWEAPYHRLRAAPRRAC